MSQEPSHPDASLAYVERIWAEHKKHFEEFGEGHLKVLRAEFENGGSPICAWWALHICYLTRLPVPDWVSRYLESVAGEMIGGPRVDLATGRITAWQDFLVAALGFKSNRSGGRSNPWEAREREYNLRQVATWVRIKIDYDGLNETDACFVVAQHLKSSRMPMSEATVKRAWKAFGEVVRQEDLSDQRYFIDILDKSLHGMSTATDPIEAET